MEIRRHPLERIHPCRWHVSRHAFPSSDPKSRQGAGTPAIKFHRVPPRVWKLANLPEAGLRGKMHRGTRDPSISPMISADMHHTSTVSPEIARAILRAAADRSPPHKRAKLLAWAAGPAENLPRELSTSPGIRRYRDEIPPNMLPSFLAGQARAWEHSALAGILWECGLRASRAIALAENHAPAREINVARSP